MLLLLPVSSQPAPHTNVPLTCVTVPSLITNIMSRTYQQWISRVGTKVPVHEISDPPAPRNISKLTTPIN